MILHTFSASENCKVLGKDINNPAINSTVAGNDPVPEELLAFHAELGAAMGLEHIKLFKAAFIEQHFDPFPGGHPAFGMLLVNAFLATAQTGQVTHFQKFVKVVAHIFSPAPLANIRD
jgi:hypothetical protein